MRIAVDARPLSTPLTGIGRYTASLLGEMLNSDEHEWFLYSDKPLTEKLPTFANCTIRTGVSKGGGPGSLRWAQYEYTRWARHDKIDLFWSPRHHLPLMLPTTISQVVTIHDLVWRRFPETMQWKNRWLERMLMSPSIKKADRVICVSHFTASEVAHFYPRAAAKSVVIHEAADQHPISTPPSTDLPNQYLLFVGTLEPRKNLNRLLRALAITQQNIPLPNVVIVGGQGWGNIDIESLLRQYKLTDIVSVTGYVDEKQLQHLYANAYCLLMPSLYEGFGLPILEAMQYGVPAIAGKAGALPEVVGRGGLLVDPTSEDDIAEAISHLLSNPGLHKELRQLAIKQNEQFSWKKAAQETLKVFEQAAG